MQKESTPVNKTTLSFVLLILGIAWPAIAQDQAVITLFFSPKGGCETAICNAIDNAESEILMAAYAFASKPIAEALYNAHKRNVTVQIILDRLQPTAHYSMADELADHGLTVRIDRKEPLMHQKIIIIDRKLLIAGSYNFTASAEHRNAEILLLIDGEETAVKAAANFLFHFMHSLPHAAKHAAKCDTKYCPSLPPETSNPFIFRRPRRWSN